MESEIQYLINHGFIFSVQPENITFISHNKKIRECTLEEEKRLDFLFAQPGFKINPEWE